MTDTAPPLSRKEKRLRRIAVQDAVVQAPEARKPLTLTKSEPTDVLDTVSLPKPDKAPVDVVASKSLPAITGSLPLTPKPMVLKPVPVLTPEEEEARERREIAKLLQEQVADDIALKRKRKLDALVAEKTAEIEALNAGTRRKKARYKKILKRTLISLVAFTAVALIAQGVVLVLQWIWS